MLHWGPLSGFGFVDEIPAFCPICIVFCYQARLKALTAEHSRIGRWLLGTYDTITFIVVTFIVVKDVRRRLPSRGSSGRTPARARFRWARWSFDIVTRSGQSALHPDATHAAIISTAGTPARSGRSGRCGARTAPRPPAAAAAASPATTRRALRLVSRGGYFVAEDDALDAARAPVLVSRAARAAVTSYSAVDDAPDCNCNTSSSSLARGGYFHSG